MRTPQEKIIDTTQCRRQNGQCAYGDWEPLADAPAAVRKAIVERRIADGLPVGTFHIGGQAWVYRQVAP
jgi:hypothetical protein